MSTPNGFEINLAKATESKNNQVGEHVVQEGYGAGSDRDPIEAILEANDKLVSQYNEQICNHFSSILERLPEALQASYIDSIRMYNDKNDVVYQGMVSRYDDRIGAKNGLDANMFT